MLNRRVEGLARGLPDKARARTTLRFEGRAAGWLRLLSTTSGRHGLATSRRMLLLVFLANPAAGDALGGRARVIDDD